MPMRLEQLPLTPLDGAAGVAMSMLAAGTSAELLRVDVAVIEPGASLPKHPAGREQVFYVVSGEVYVAADDDVEHHVRSGSSVIWSPGERHTSRAETRMTVVILQRRQPD